MHSREIVFQKWDEKAAMWARHLEQHGYRCAGLQGSAAYAPLVLLRTVFRSGRPAAYVFRYLSDYPGLAKTLARTFSEVVTAFVAYCSGIRILWIMHNLDRESAQNWPAISRLRRGIVGKLAHACFVTDPLMVEQARALYPDYQWRSLSFGVEADRGRRDPTMEVVVAAAHKLRDDLARRLGKNKTIYIGLCFTSMSEKCVHLFRYRELLALGGSSDFLLGLVFVGDFSGAGEKWRRIAEEISGYEGAMVIDESCSFDEANISPHFDFFYRSLIDISMPYSVYRAAACGLPIITHPVGFCGEIVKEYGVGYVVSGDDDTGAGEFLKNWNKEAWSDFLSRRSWEKAAETFARVVS